MAQTHLDSAYRRWLNGRYTRLGFDRVRMYVDPLGFSYVSTPCYYCGNPATCEDHTMPLVLLRSLIDAGADEPTKKYWLVPACHECNNTLHSKRFLELRTRKAYIKQRLRKRYARILAIPTWHKDELDELGFTLRTNILQGMEQKHLIQERLAW